MCRQVCPFRVFLFLFRELYCNTIGVEFQGLKMGYSPENCFLVQENESLDRRIKFC